MKNDEILGMLHLLVGLIRRTPHCHAPCPPPPHAAQPGMTPPPPPADRHPFRERGRILIILEREDGITQKRLAELLEIRPQSLSELLTKLETDGMIERACNEQDKRETLVFLSAQGRARLAAIKENREQFAGEFLSALSDGEKEQLATLLRKLLDANKK